MNTIYIKEYDNEDIFNNKVPKFISKIMIRLNIIMPKKIDNNKKIYFIPNIANENICKNIIKKLNKEQTKTQKVQIVLSEKMKRYKNELRQYKIIDGRIIMQNFIEQIIKRVSNNKIELQDIYITVNNYYEYPNSIIKKIAEKVKSINIITKEIDKYSILENIYSESGIVISIGNNKKKSLKKANIIINIDFSENDFKKYIINRNAIIINLSLNKICSIKLFEGIIIEDIEFDLNNEVAKMLDENYLNNKFKKIEIYDTIKDRIDMQKINILFLYGNNGQINEKELINIQKIIDK